MPDFKPFRHFLDEAINLLFPPLCQLCKTMDGNFLNATLCQSCWEKIYAPSQLILPRTGTCDAGGFAAGTYQGTLQELITRAKFHADPRAFSSLARLLHETTSRMVTDLPAAICSVPGDPRRLRKRGFDLPGMLAQNLSRKLRIPFQRHWLKRIRKAVPQTSLTREERLANLQGVFQSNEAAKDQRIWVMDDVFTTGATALATIAALQAAGASGVTFSALARTPELPLDI